MSGNQQVLAGLGGSPVTGQTLLTASSGNWVCPAGVTSVSVVCIGSGSTINYGGYGGSLRYVNNIAVTPGVSYPYVIPAPDTTAQRETYFNTTSVCSARTGYGVESGAGVNTGTGGNGGNGGVAFGGGGGGAGGYSGNGGNGGTNNGNGTAGTGGGGGGGGGGNPTQGSTQEGGGGGGGTSPYGSGGGSGALGTYATGGGGGSGGGSGGGGTGGGWGGSGGLFGGGRGYNTDHPSPRPSGGGCIRIIWPGNLRQFPSTRTADE